ncbi:autotransporter-associated beta strand repeat-containing protein [Akkermansia glycaniphila]|uniref:Pectin lyase fold/virulence factor n=3 Tax=Akkermansia TaxID=239934 RepID=A0A1C7PC26_9BACT|nr:autotransporter-associated beta strand repeat-containing protein [Akkermansia glycaniphila]OCA03087.1 hypothetical protein AC781_06900 [Akkermansia glycaniphila]SEH85914.1 pectin lyase fold/virulence factor [Akkermansia glycaniphila]
MFHCLRYHRYLIALCFASAPQIMAQDGSIRPLESETENRDYSLSLSSARTGNPAEFQTETYADTAASDPLGYGYYLWTGKGSSSNVLDKNNWTYDSGTPDPSNKATWGSSQTPTFLVLDPNLMSTFPNGLLQNAQMSINFTPLTLSGIIVKARTDGKSDKFAITNVAGVGETSGNLVRYLNLVGVNGADVTFQMDGSLELGNATNPFTGVNVDSNWNINFADGKYLNVYGSMRSMAGTRISLTGKGTLNLFNANRELNAEWHLADGASIVFNRNADISINSTNFLGTGDIHVTSGVGTLQIAGDNGALFSNNVIIEQGATFHLMEGIRDTTTVDLIVYSNMTGKISGSGNMSFERQNSGKNYCNESWVFTGDNSGFTGNWLTDRDINSYNDRDKRYGIIPLMFGDGQTLKGTNESIAGTGAIIGTSANNRGGSLVGINYSNDVTLINSLQGELRLHHLTDSTLTLTGNNSHIYGTYVEAGGTLRVYDVSALGDANTYTKSGVNNRGGAVVALNNGSTFEYAGDSNANAITNGLFNTEGTWGINIAKETTVLTWDISQKAVYKDAFNAQSARREGNFTKSGAGTLKITGASSAWDGQGKLFTSSTKAGTLFLNEGTLEIGDNASLGNVGKIVMGGATLKQSGGNQVFTLGSGVTLTTDKAIRYAMNNTIDGGLKVSGGIMEFVMSPKDIFGTPGLPAYSFLNSYNVTGNFDLSSTGTFSFVLDGGMAFDKEGYYLMFTAANDMSSMDWSRFKLSGVETGENSRQKYAIYTGGTVISAEETVAGTSNEVYLQATPDLVDLRWNRADGGTWMAGKDISAQSDWHLPNYDDSRFFQSDRVIFGDTIMVDGKAVTLTGEQTITLGGDVRPSRITVEGNADYVITSQEGASYGIGGQAALYKTGSGQLDIRTSNTYSGGTIVSEGAVRGIAANSFGSGLITINNTGQVFTFAENALGSCDIKIEGGQLLLYSTNRNQGDVTMNGGTITAGAALSLGETGNITINGGSLYATAQGALGNNTIKLTGGHIYAHNVNSLGSSNIVAHGAADGAEAWIHTSAFDHASSLGAGKIALQEGSVLYLEGAQGKALDSLSLLTFDGGRVYVDGTVDASGFTNYHSNNGRNAIFDVEGANAQLTVADYAGTDPSITIEKLGTGILSTTVHTDINASLLVREGSIVLNMSDKGGSAYQLNGSIAGDGTIVIRGSHAFRAGPTQDFRGTFYIDQNGEDKMMIVSGNSNRKDTYYDVVLNRGNISMWDSSSDNHLVWGNLSSGTGDYASLCTIGVNSIVDAGNVYDPFMLTVHQTRNEIFKGTFIDGGVGKKVVADFEKMGAATLTLTGDSTSTGTMYIREGAIQLGNGGTTGHWAGNIENNARLAMNYGAVDKTFNSTISGTGAVSIQTGGTVTITKDNTYAGGTEIGKGRVLLDNTGTLGSGEITMSGTSSLEVAATAAADKGLVNSSVRVADNANASVKNADLGQSGRIYTANGTISVKGGQNTVTVTTGSSKSTLSGTMKGAAVSLSTIDTNMVAVLQHGKLDTGAKVTATAGESKISGGLWAIYDASSLDLSNEAILTESKLAIADTATMNVGDLSVIVLDLNQSILDQLTGAGKERLSINLFDSVSDMNSLINGGSQIYIDLSTNFREAGWSVSRSSVDTASGTAWWDNGIVVLEHNVPEPSSATLIMFGAASLLLRRRRGK